VAHAEEPTEPLDESDSIELVLKLEIAKLQLEKLIEEQNAPKTVPDKIVYWAEHFGADVSVSKNIACAESMFIPHAQNPYSSAGGVYQWIDGSWARMSNMYYGYVEDKMNEDRNIELSNWVIATYGTSDWNASKYEGVGGGWMNKPYERGYCKIA
jgi:hypothetical protein